MKTKVFIIGVIGVILCLVLAGCGEKKENTISDQSNQISNTIITDNSIDNNLGIIDLYSDDTKIVFKNSDLNTLVFYYEGDKITGYHAYIDYGDPLTANVALANYTYDESVDKVYTQGKYLIVEFKESEYSDLKTSDVRLVYSYLEEITK